MAERLFETIGLGYMNKDKRYNTNEARLENRSIVDKVVADWILERTKKEVMKTFVDAGVTVAPLYSIADIVEDQHFIDRKIYTEIPDIELGSIPVHKAVPDMSATPACFRSAAPLLGEHNHEILSLISWNKRID